LTSIVIMTRRKLIAAAFFAERLPAIRAANQRLPGDRQRAL